MDLTNGSDPRYIELEFSNLHGSESLTSRANISVGYSKLMHCSHIDEILLNFTLSNHRGEKVNLRDCIAGKPVVLLIHKGQPFNQQETEFQAWVKALPIFNQLGITAIEIVPSSQSSLFSSITDPALKFKVLIDNYNQVAQPFTLVDSTAITQSLSCQNSDDQFGWSASDSLCKHPKRIICVIAGDTVFFKSYATSEYVRPIDPMHYVTLLDPDYWLALS